jgi:hypothetical protein
MVKAPRDSPLSLISADGTSVPPPITLKAPGRQLWDSVMRQYAFSDAGGIALLGQICAAWDRVEDLAAVIERDGAVIYSRTGVPKGHPALRDEIANRAFISRGLERLALNLEPVRGMGRPPKPSGWSPR